MNISALIIARNEERNIEDTLKSLSFVDEIVVILDRSIDATQKICKKYTTKIFCGSWVCEGQRRNYGIRRCSSEWVLEVDADEIISRSLKREILIKKNNKNFDYFYIKLLNFVGSRPIKFGWMACMAPDGKFCFFKKKSKKWNKGLVHPGYSMNGKKGPELENYIVHRMSNNISDLVSRFNRNTSLYSLELRNQKHLKKISLRKVISRFIKSFFSRKGYKSGKIGFLIAILNSIYPLVALIKSRE